MATTTTPNPKEEESAAAVDRLCDDAVRPRVRSQQRNTKADTSAGDDKETHLHELTTPTFRPNLGEAFAHHHHTSTSRETTPIGGTPPVVERLYQDAVHRQEELDHHHDCERERPALDEGGNNNNDEKGDGVKQRSPRPTCCSGSNDDEHVHLKNRHEHPFATDLCPKADYLRRMDTSMSVDGGSIENGLYEDSSVSSGASISAPAVCECGNIIQVEVDLDEQIHSPSETHVARAFSPDIHETQEVVSSPRSSRIHGKETSSVFDRLHHNKEQRERKLTMERNRIKKYEDKELTFRPKTNIKHGREQKMKTKGVGGGRKKNMSDRHGGAEKRFCEKCLDEQQDQKKSEARLKPSTGIDTQELELDSPAQILAKELQIADDEDVNGPFLDAGETFAALSAQQ